MEDKHVSGTLSGLVILAAIAITYTTYSAYRDQVVANQQDEVRSSMDQAASVLVAYREAKIAKAALATSTATTTTKTSDKKVELR